MQITVTDKGFVATEPLTPIGYAGEVNSRQLEVSHPHFKDCCYQILVKRYDGLYKLGVVDGIATIPPSLLKTATTLDCQFVAIATPCSVVNAEADNFAFMSSPFQLTVAPGLEVGGLSPIPTYEELQEMYCNINMAKAEVENAKKSNEQIYQSIQAALQQVYNTPVVDLEIKFRDEYKKQLDIIAEEHFVEFTSAITNEIIARITNGEVIPGGSQMGEVATMSKDELAAYIEQIHNELVDEVKSGTASWFPNSGVYTMSKKGDVIGGR